MAASANAKVQYIASLQAGAITFPRIVLGQLEPHVVDFIAARRLDLGWPPHEHSHIEIRRADIAHQLKRLGEGITAEEMWRMVEWVLHPKAQVRMGGDGRTLLFYFETVELEVGHPFTPQGIVMDGMDWKAPRLYGLIPKGWRGRK